MKRLIAAVSFSLLAAPALAEVGLPYEQNQFDRQLPNIEFTAVERTQVAETASAGNTRSDAEIATGEAPAAEAPNGSGLATGVWANDYHFIAPAK